MLVRKIPLLVRAEEGLGTYRHPEASSASSEGHLVLNWNSSDGNKTSCLG